MPYPNGHIIHELIAKVDALDRQVAAAQVLLRKLASEASAEQQLANARNQLSRISRELRAQASGRTPSTGSPGGRATASTRSDRREPSAAARQAIAARREKAHITRPAPPNHPPAQVTCPYCGSLMLPQYLSAHLEQKHAGTAPRVPGRGKKPRSAVRRASTPSTRQMTRDPYDGGRDLSESRRDGGRFGSLPLYDAYDEESNP